MTDLKVASRAPALAIPPQRSSDVPNDAVRLLTWAAAADRLAAERECSAYTSELIASFGRGLILCGLDLEGADLRGFDLRKADLTRAVLHDADLSGADLTDANLTCPSLEKTKLAGARLSGAYMHGIAAQVCDFRDADLSEVVDCTGASFHGCDFSRANWSHSTLSGSCFYQCNLRGARLHSSRIDFVAFVESSLDGAELRGASVAHAALKKCSVDRLDLAGAHGEALSIERPTAANGVRMVSASLPSLRIFGLAGSDLQGAGLDAADADFAESSVAAADFSQANLRGSRWVRCMFSGAKFEAATIACASFERCVGRGINLRSAAAENVRFVESDLTDCDASLIAARCAIIRDSDISRAKLSRAYFYRAMLTGDPPSNLRLVGADLQGANLVQAYIAADATDANLVGAKLAYARLNQSNLSGADARGADLSNASFVKTNCRGLRLSAPIGRFPLMFIDRSPGLLDAITALPDSDSRSALLSSIVGMAEIFTAARRRPR